MQAAEVRLRLLHVAHDLRLQLLRTRKLPLVANATQKLNSNPQRGRLLESVQQKGFDRQILAAERWPVTDVRDRVPSTGAVELMGAGDVHAGARKHLGRRSEI